MSFISLFSASGSLVDLASNQAQTGAPATHGAHFLANKLGKIPESNWSINHSFAHDVFCGVSKIGAPPSATSWV